MKQDKWIKPSEAVQIAGVSRQRLNELWKQNRIRWRLQEGSSRREYLREDIENYNSIVDGDYRGSTRSRKARNKNKQL